MRARVLVTLKPEVLDPQGRAIQHAAASLGCEAVQDVRQGKLFEVTFADGVDESRARRELEELCRKLLANPVIEDSRVLDLEAAPAPGR